MTRRQAMAMAGAAHGWVTSLKGAPQVSGRMGATPSAFQIRAGAARTAKQQFDLLEYARSLGMGGAQVGREGAALTGRRYEVFDTPEAFRQHKEQCEKALALAEPVMRRERLKLAFENHKDWRWEEHVAMATGSASSTAGHFCRCSSGE